MSRSRKKKKWLKDRNKGSKKISHGKFRAKEKNALHHDKELPKKQAEAENPYNIHDYKFLCEEKNCRCEIEFGFKKCMRK